MKKKDYKKLSFDIVDKVGGIQNIESLTHCMTRLRFKLKDENIALTEDIKAIESVLAVIQANEQYQVVIGNDVVNVFDEIMKNFDIKADKEELPEADSAVNSSSKNGFKQFREIFIDYITGTMTQILPVLISAGLLSVGLAIATKFFGVSTDNITYKIFNYVYNAGFYYLPIYVGFAASKKLKSNSFLAAMMGAILLHPTYLGMVGEGIKLSVFGISFTSISYSSTVIPMLLITFVMAKIEKLMFKILPNAIKSTFAPLLVIVITVPLSLIVIGPIGYTLGAGIVNIILWIYGLSPFLIVPISAIMWPILVMFGAHTLLVPTMTELLATVGFDAAIKPGAWCSNFAILGVCLAVAYKSKKMRNSALPAAISAVFGVTEPGVYGIIVPLKKTLISMLLGSLVGGISAAILGVKSNILAANSILSIVMFGDTLLGALIATVISLVAGFVFTLIIGFKE